MRSHRHLIVSLCLFPAVAVAAVPAGIPLGYYMGYGDGCRTVVSLLPHHRAVLGAFDEYQGMGYQPKPVTPARIRHAIGSGNGNPSTYRYDPETHILTLKTPIAWTKKASACVHTFRLEKGGLMPVKERSIGSLSACSSLHGASWGYTGNSLLKRIHLPR